MWWIAPTTAFAIAIVAAQVLLAQTPAKPMTPTAPGTRGDPAWQGIVRLSDGRTFVTDGGLAIDAALAKPDRLPARELAAKVLEQYLNESHKDEYGLRDLDAAVSGRTYSSPSGIALNGTYVDYLRRTLPPGSVRLRMSGTRQPVVIVAGGRAVGVLMPVAQ